MTVSEGAQRERATVDQSKSPRLTYHAVQTLPCQPRAGDELEHGEICADRRELKDCEKQLTSAQCRQAES